ncbi:MAG: NAD(P)/FAD-dependent oxidoreductase [Planctomycetota bacterium]
MGGHLVLVGGGHAHLTCLKRLRDFVERGHRVTLISLSPYQYYSGMGPGLLSRIYRPQEVRFHVRKMAEDRGGRFVEGRVVRVDADERRLMLESGAEVAYDVASFNTGSEVEAGKAGAEGAPDVHTVKPIANLLAAQESILRKVEGGGPVAVVAVGGGAAAVEMAANAERLVLDAGAEAAVTLIGAGRLLERFPDRMRELALRSFRERDVRVLEGRRVEDLGNGRARTAAGETVEYDTAIVATGVRPSSLYADSGLPTGERGGLLVDEHLRCVEYPEIFGGGDCISLQGHDLERVGVYAVRQNPILYHNLIAALERGELRRFEPGGDYLIALNMGDGTGVAAKWGLAFDGRTAFWLKDYIDRRFMRRFQVSGERDEPPQGDR